MMWDETSGRIEAEASLRSTHYALAEAEACWPFLSAAKTDAEYLMRKATLSTSTTWAPEVHESFDQRFAEQQRDRAASLIAEAFAHDVRRDIADANRRERDNPTSEHVMDASEIDAMRRKQHSDFAQWQTQHKNWKPTPSGTKPSPAVRKDLDNEADRIHQQQVTKPVAASVKAADLNLEDTGRSEWASGAFESPKTRTVDGVNVHEFSSTGQAYNQTQVDDSIKDGDVLIVPSEGVYGFLNEAWPIAVVGQGEFHTVRPGMDPAEIEGGKYAKSVAVARGLAGKTAAGQKRASGDDTKCYNCSPEGSGRDYSGGTCVYCNGTGIDRTPYGTGGDHCPWCAADWKRPHDSDCPSPWNRTVTRRTESSLGTVDQMDELLQAEAALDAADGDLDKAANFLSHPKAADPVYRHLIDRGEQIEDRHKKERADEASSEQRHDEYWKAHPDEAARHRQQNFAALSPDEMFPDLAPEKRPYVCGVCGLWRNAENCPHCDAKRTVKDLNRKRRGPTIVDWLAHGLLPSGAAASKRTATPLPTGDGTERYYEDLDGADTPDPMWEEPGAAEEAEVQKALDENLNKADAAYPKDFPKAKTAAEENLFGDVQADEFASVHVPKTTRPRVTPEPKAPPAYVEPTQPGMGAFDVPTVEQAVAAKVAKIAKTVMADNPHLSAEAARDLAEHAVRSYPEMVSTQR